MPSREEVKQACELLNMLFENYGKYEELADYAAKLISDTTMYSLPGVKRPAKGPNSQAKLIDE